jgi:hypothetical protein
VKSVKRKQAFWRLLAVYPIVGALGLALTGWNAFGGGRAGEASEADVQKEMDKLRRVE